MERLKTIAVTSSNVPSGTVLAYLLETTRLKIEKIYLDRGENGKKAPTKKRQPKLAKKRWFNDWKTCRCHLGLVRAMPKRYVFAVLQKLSGVAEFDFLHRCERISPGLFQYACGFPLPERPAGKPLLRKLKETAQEYSIPLVSTPNLNSETTVAELQEAAPDVIIALGTRILSPEFLSTARIGVLNAHSSLLPEYRGGVTEFWQLAGGEKETGVTVHWMAPKVDQGPICTQKSWPIPRKANHHQLRLMSLFFRLELWREVVERLLAGEIPRQRQRAATTPTFKCPTLSQEYDFYCRCIRPALPT